MLASSTIVASAQETDKWNPPVSDRIAKFGQSLNTSNMVTAKRDYVGHEWTFDNEGKSGLIVGTQGGGHSKALIGVSLGIQF